MNLLDAFTDLPDPRLDRQKKHNLIDIISLTICGVLAGEDTFVDIEYYARNKLDFFNEFLELPNGIPSHDTFNRVWNLIDPKIFENHFQNWINEVKSAFDLSGKVVAIDGKTMRGSAKKSKGTKGLHIISAYATELGLTLGQVTTPDKSNEIKAIPDLIDNLYLKGCIVTIDAMGCQKEIAHKIVAKGADACLAVKQNQPSLYENVSLYFKSCIQEDSKDFEFFETIEKNHGRIETRQCTVSYELDWLQEQHPDWPVFKSIICINSQREIGEKKEHHTRYYFSTDRLSAEKALEVIRSHWAIENSLHYVLDVVFKEDGHQLKAKSAAANLNVIRKMVLGLLKKIPSERKFPSLKAKRKLCSWDNDFLLEVLGFVKTI